MLIRIISIVGSLTFLSRVLGYIRDLLIARVIGAGIVSDCFFVAFKLPNLFRRIFGEGAMSAAFIPVLSGILSKSGNRNADMFFSKIFSILLVFLFSFLILAEIFMPFLVKLLAPGFNSNPEKITLAVNLSRLTFPFLLFICLTSLIGAYLNTLGRFASMAVTPIILNLSIISVLIFLFDNEDKIYISNYLSLSISFAGIIQLIWMYYNLKKNNILLAFNFRETFKVNKETSNFFKLLLPAILGNGAYQINLLVDMILASTLPDGSISYLYYADRVNQLPLGVLGIAISTALLPVISMNIKKREVRKVNKNISSALKFAILFSIPSFFGLFILSEDIVSFLFFRGAFNFGDVKLTSQALTALCTGLPAFIMVKILVVPFFANEDTKTPIKISLFCMILNLILNLILIKDFLHVGLAISTSVSAWINCILLGWILRKKFDYKFDKSLAIVFFKVVLSSSLMSLAIWKATTYNIINIVDNIFFDENFILILYIICGIIVYFTSILFLGTKELEIKKWKTHKKKN